MKNSNIQWIGDIPDDWEVVKVKYVCNFKTGGTPSNKEGISDEGGIPWITAQDMDHGLYLKKYTQYITKNALQKYNYKLFPKGSILLVCIASVGKNGMALCECYSNQQITALMPNIKIIDRFLLYTINALKPNIVFLASSNVVPIINTQTIGNLSIPLPPLPIQTAIANYLDSKCSEIDGLISDINQQIDTLNELKKSTITEAVTKGLNKNVKLKDSGIQWIGMIPEGWKESRLGYESWIRARLGWKGLKAEEYVSEGHPFLSAFNIQNNHLSWSDLNFIDDRRYNESPEIMLKVGDIVLVKDGAGIGKCAKITDLPYGTATTNSSLGVITTDKDLHYNYLYYYFQSAIFQNIISRMLNGMGVPHLTQEVLNNIRIPVPPLTEQHSIATYLDTKCTEFDSIISDKQKQISTLEAYKKSLIYEYVTGKKKVG